MRQYKSQTLKLRPEFDLELFMAMCQETRMEAATVDLLASTWAQWLDILRVERFSDGEEGYLLIWLSGDVEAQVQARWDESNYKGFLLHNLAQAMVMAAARELVPDLVEVGCAPMPNPEPGLAAAIELNGLTWSPKTGGLSNMYSILTPHPFSGGCQACFLKPKCPHLTQQA